MNRLTSCVPTCWLDPLPVCPFHFGHVSRRLHPLRLLAMELPAFSRVRGAEPPGAGSEITLSLLAPDKKPPPLASWLESIFNLGGVRVESPRGGGADGGLRSWKKNIHWLIFVVSFSRFGFRLAGLKGNGAHYWIFVFVSRGLKQMEDKLQVFFTVSFFFAGGGSVQ